MFEIRRQNSLYLFSVTPFLENTSVQTSKILSLDSSFRVSGKEFVSGVLPKQDPDPNLERRRLWIESAGADNGRHVVAGHYMKQFLELDKERLMSQGSLLFPILAPGKLDETIGAGLRREYEAATGISFPDSSGNLKDLLDLVAAAKLMPNGGFGGAILRTPEQETAGVARKAANDPLNKPIDNFEKIAGDFFDMINTNPAARDIHEKTGAFLFKAAPQDSKEDIHQKQPVLKERQFYRDLSTKISQIDTNIAATKKIIEDVKKEMAAGDSKNAAKLQKANGDLEQLLNARAAQQQDFFKALEERFTAQAGDILGTLEELKAKQDVIFDWVQKQTIAEEERRKISANLRQIEDFGAICDAITSVLNLVAPEAAPVFAAMAGVILSIATVASGGTVAAIAGLVVAIVNLIGVCIKTSSKSFEEVAVEYLEAIRTALESLRMEMHGRFDRLEYRVMRVQEMLNHLDMRLQRLELSLLEVNAKLNRIDRRVGDLSERYDIESTSAWLKSYEAEEFAFTGAVKDLGRFIANGSQMTEAERKQECSRLAAIFIDHCDNTASRLAHTGGDLRLTRDHYDDVGYYYGARGAEHLYRFFPMFLTDQAGLPPGVLSDHIQVDRIRSFSAVSLGIQALQKLKNAAGADFPKLSPLQLRQILDSVAAVKANYEFLTDARVPDAVQRYYVARLNDVATYMAAFSQKAEVKNGLRVPADFDPGRGIQQLEAPNFVYNTSAAMDGFINFPLTGDMRADLVKLAREPVYKTPGLADRIPNVPPGLEFRIPRALLGSHALGYLALRMAPFAAIDGDNPEAAAFSLSFVCKPERTGVQKRKDGWLNLHTGYQFEMNAGRDNIPLFRWRHFSSFVEKAFTPQMAPNGDIFGKLPKVWEKTYLPYAETYFKHVCDHHRAQINDPAVHPLAGFSMFTKDKGVTEANLLSPYFWDNNKTWQLKSTKLPLTPNFELYGGPMSLFMLADSLQWDYQRRGVGEYNPKVEAYLAKKERGVLPYLYNEAVTPGSPFHELLKELDGAKCLVDHLYLHGYADYVTGDQQNLLTFFGPGSLMTSGRLMRHIAGGLKGELKYSDFLQRVKAQIQADEARLAKVTAEVKTRKEKTLPPNLERMLALANQITEGNDKR